MLTSPWWWRFVHSASPNGKLGLKHGTSKLFCETTLGNFGLPSSHHVPVESPVACAERKQRSSRVLPSCLAHAATCFCRSIVSSRRLSVQAVWPCKTSARKSENCASYQTRASASLRQRPQKWLITAGGLISTFIHDAAAANLCP